jgi:hypothetical protein
MRIGQYAKAIVLVLAAGLSIFVAASTDGVVSPVEYTNIGLGILTAVGVYLIPNLKAGVGKYAKTIVAFGGAALTALAVVVATSADWNGVSQNDWLGVLLAGLAAIGLFIVPNSSAVPAVSTVNITNELSEKDQQVIADEVSRNIEFSDGKNV